MDTPYQPPDQIAAPPIALGEVARKRFWKRMIWVSTAIMLILPLATISGLVITLIRAFGSLRGTGVADPSVFAVIIGDAIIRFIVSIIFSLPALIFLIVSIIRYRRLSTPA